MLYCSNLIYIFIWRHETNLSLWFLRQEEKQKSHHRLWWRARSRQNGIKNLRSQNHIIQPQNHLTHPKQKNPTSIQNTVFSTFQVGRLPFPIYRCHSEMGHAIKLPGCWKKAQKPSSIWPNNPLCSRGGMGKIYSSDETVLENKKCKLRQDNIV